jgi:glycine/D-amino acid oxidase-like deaminating enzyme
MVKDFIKSSFDHFKNTNSVYHSTVFTMPIPKVKDWYHCGKYKAKNIIYCEGANVIKNTLFNYLPVIPNKGELLKINCSSIPKKLISKGVFILPEKQKNIFTIGSTYDHTDRSYEPTLKAKKYLLSKFNTIGNFKYTILNQEVGFRPTTNDRRPVVGEHPILKNSYILNGLGSKGVMSAPWLADNLIRHIIFNESIESEVDISRHRKKMSKENINFASNLCNS